jgi:hypothetical protein
MSKKLMLLAFVLLVFIPAAFAANLGTDPDLVIYYSFDEFTDVVMDQSTRGHNGAVEGDVTPDPQGLYNGAARFANGAFLDLDGPSIPPEHIPTSAITLAAWAKCENTGGHHAIFNARAGDSTWLVHPELRSGGNFRWLLRSAGGTTMFDIGAGVVTWDEWLHYAGTYDKAVSRGTLHINGVAVQSANVTAGAEIAGDWNQGARVGRNIDNARPFTGLMDEFCLFTRALSEAEIQVLMQGIRLTPAELASEPDPAHEANDVSIETALSWTPGIYAAAHDIYLGTVLDDVNNASGAAPLDVLVSQGQNDASYVPESPLEYGQTYYWRIDEVNAAPDSTIFKGLIWMFETEPFAYPAKDIIATTNGVSVAGSGPEKTIDGSGLNEDDEHSTKSFDMWQATPGDGPVWIQYDLGRILKLHEVLVWNYNVEFERVLGFGFKDVAVDYSSDGENWAALGDVEFSQASASTGYAANTTVDFAGTPARYVRLTANSTWGDMGQYGLSEVRFLYIPTQARKSEPADGATDVSVETVLAWRAGREAASHDVYFGTDPSAVTDGTALLGSTDERSYAIAPLNFGTTYYWRIDEVNDAMSPSVWEGNLWSFVTQEYATVDDFEGYTDNVDAEETIYQTWIDGWTNETGSIVGHMDAPFAERKIVHEGRQSMPLSYDNSVAPFYSEAYRTWPTAQDWTAGAADTLTLYIQGDPDNEPVTLYVVLEDSAGNVAAVSHSDADATLATDWQPWSIPLSAFASAGVDVASITTMYIGAGDRNSPSAGGTGLIYIDDILVGHPVTEAISQ